MNRVVLWLLGSAAVTSGSLFCLLSYRVLVNLRESSATAGSGYTSAAKEAPYQALPPDGQAEWMTGFTLIERSGRELHWDDLEGKVRVTSFFFSSCPANCLQMNMKIREVQRAYAGQGVAFVSITCDPDIDSPERLREYAAKLEAPADQWLFLTGKLVYIRRVAGELFGVALDKQTHTERLIVSDKWGHTRGTFHWNKLDEMAELRLLVDKLLQETEPPAGQEKPGTEQEPGNGEQGREGQRDKGQKIGNRTD